MSDYARWRDRFADVLDPTRHTIDWLDEQVRAGIAIMWATDDAAMLTELRRYPTGAVEIHGLVAAGDLDSIRDELIPKAENWAKRAGCIAAVIESRPGWAKAMKSAGYAVHQVAIRKEF